MAKTAYPALDMFGIEWSPAQKAQSQKLANRAPEIRQCHVQLANWRKMNPGASFRCGGVGPSNGNDLLSNYDIHGSNTWVRAERASTNQ